MIQALCVILQLVVDDFLKIKLKDPRHGPTAIDKCYKPRLKFRLPSLAMTFQRLSYHMVKNKELARRRIKHRKLLHLIFTNLSSKPAEKIVGADCSVCDFDVKHWILRKMVVKVFVHPTKVSLGDFGMNETKFHWNIELS